MWQPVGNECVINIAVLFIRLRLREEVNLYLSCPSVDTSAVFAFSQLATAFGRYNATLPSSDCGETVLSVAGQMLIPRRCKMSDIVFEQTVFLRYKLKEQE